MSSLPEAREFDPMSYRSGPSDQGTTAIGTNYSAQEYSDDAVLEDFVDAVDGISWGLGDSSWGPNKATIRQAANLTSNYLAVAKHLLSHGDSEGAIAAISKCLQCYAHLHSYIRNTLR